jgi:hypothetical protein
MWVPPAVHRDILDERRRFDAATLKGLELLEELRRFNEELQRIDPHLELVRASPNATLPGLKPGYYHVVRHNPDAPVSVDVLEGPDGEFVEPGSNVFDMLERSDMWSERAMKIRQKKELDAARSKERAREKEREDRIYEFKERWKQANSDQILIKEAPWARS